MKTLSKNLIANTFAQIWNALLGIVFVPYYVKLLGTESYGLIGFFASFNFILSFLDLGLNAMLSREFAKDHNKFNNKDLFTLFRTIEIIIFAIASIFVVFTTFFSHWIATSWLQLSSLKVDVVSICIQIMGWIIFSRLIEGVYKSVFFGLQNHVLINVINIIFTTSRSIGIFGILLWVSNSVLAYFIWQLINFIIPLLIYVAIFYKKFFKEISVIKFNFQSLNGKWKFAGGMFFISILSLFLTQLDKIFLSKMIPLSEFGHYSIATSVSFIILFISYPIVNTYYPKLVQLYSNDSRLEFNHHFHRSSQLITFFSSILSFFLFFYADEILRVWGLKHEIVMSVNVVLKFLVLGNLFSALILIPYQVHLVAGKIKFNVYMNILSVIIFPILYYLGSKYYGIKGAAFCYFLFNFFYFVFFFVFMSNTLFFNQKFRWLKDDVLKTTFTVFIICLISKASIEILNFKINNLIVLTIFFSLLSSISILLSKNIRGITINLIKRTCTLKAK